MDHGLRLGLQDAVASGRAEREHGLAVLQRDGGRKAHPETFPADKAVRRVRVKVAPVHEVVHGHAGSRNDNAGSEHGSEALGQAHGIAVAIDGGKRCCVLAQLHALGQSAVAELFCAPDDRRWVEEALAQRDDIALAQQFRDPRRRALVVADTGFRGEADGPENCVQMICRKMLHGADIDTIE